MSKKQADTKCSPNGDGMMTYDEFMELQRQREEIMTRNHFSFSGQVDEIKPLDLSERKDKNGQPILDETGQPTFYDPLFWVTVLALGSVEGFLLTPEQINNIEVGRSYLFEGKIRNRKLKVSSVTSI